MSSTPAVLEKFRNKATAVSAVVTEVGSMAAAVAYTVDLCARKEACRLLLSGCQEPLSDKGEDLCRLKSMSKIIAAPLLADDTKTELIEQAAPRGISVIESGLRRHLAGIDIALTVADWGIAETGTLVLDSSREELRLATMLCEIHIAVLPESRIRPTAEDLYKELESCLQQKPGYLAFVTGASRTADIERVLALGVHGPLELHILLLEEN